MSYSISRIAEITGGDLIRCGEDDEILHLITDSRKMLFPKTSLFFALLGKSRNGNQYISALVERGVRNFCVKRDYEFEATHGTFNFIFVDDVLSALQHLAAHHRLQFEYPVIGITGSNGKTIVKEWLSQLLGDDCNIVRSPKSYNSQVGVALSVWRMNAENELGIFEAGISTVNEMPALENIIRPQVGILNFIGAAHDAGFTGRGEKIDEKLNLFTRAETLIIHGDDAGVSNAVDAFKIKNNPALNVFSISGRKDADLKVLSIEKRRRETGLLCAYRGTEFSYTIPFTDSASVYNSLSCAAAMLVLAQSPENIKAGMPLLRAVEMRLEMHKGINNSSVINDGYSADLSSLSTALDFLMQQQQHSKRTVILSDFLEAGKTDEKLYLEIAGILKDKSLSRFIGVGQKISANAGFFRSIGTTRFFQTTEELLEEIPALDFANETVLLKGARSFRFERVADALEHRVHETQLEINLSALRHNLNVYRRELQPGTRIMAMVKAFSYGSGSFEIANLLQHAGADYLAVAYADEGAELRRSGISMPIMVMNPEEGGFASLVKYKLEPELYSFKIAEAFLNYLQQKKIAQHPVHIKIDTGMHRLGFREEDADKLAVFLSAHAELKVVSVFSHLAAGEDAAHDEYTRRQSGIFKKVADLLSKMLPDKFIRHISNSSSVYRHPDLQLDMVRLGIGLYGIDANTAMLNKLMPVTALKTTISQIKKIDGGESIGYSRRGMLKENATIATVRLGYADGYPRVLGNGVGKMLVNGNPAPVIGNVCMDMTMLNITGIEAAEGDEVIVFGEEPSVTAVAQWADTISYEILTNISQRVKRVYYEE